MPTKNELDRLLYIQRENEFYHEPNTSENTLYEMVTSGDVEAILENKRKYANSTDTAKGVLSKNPLRNQIYHLVVNAALITRACAAAGMPTETAYTLSDMYIRKADSCTSTKEVTELNDEMVMDFALRMQKIKSRYSSAIKKSIDYISDNLGKKITAESVAAAAGYHRCHLHALFKKELGMGIHEYITAKRIDAAEKMLSGSNIPIADISQALGFSTQSHFCKVFKEHKGRTPKKYRESL
ncbi:MAG: helix-turn-helix transcriptional regulator [Eubacterium sp.]|nr:helix-turn-helix transcriptional regulator [Eubacterium sp.]